MAKKLVALYFGTRCAKDAKDLARSKEESRMRIIKSGNPLAVVGQIGLPNCCAEVWGAQLYFRARIFMDPSGQQGPS